MEIFIMYMKLLCSLCRITKMQAQVQILVPNLYLTYWDSERSESIISCNCQALAPNPLVPNQKLWGLGLTLKSHRPTPHPTTLYLLSMKEGSQKKRKVQNSPPYLSIKNKSGGQQEEGHGVVHHVQ